MKNKITAVAILTLAPIGAAFAAGAPSPNNTGCGLGSMLFDGQGGLPPQVLAVTTNSSFGNQTFGISSGTLGCAQDGVVQTPVKVSMYLDNNLDKVAHDMAAGRGEALDALANLMGMDASHKATFFSMTKSNFDSIITSDSTHTKDVIAALNRLLAADRQLARYAHLV
jgi:hypothetical protein